MNTTTKSAVALAGILQDHEWTLMEAAAATGIAFSTIHHHMRRTRPIRDDHLAAYCRALTPPERRALVAAWLCDTLDTDTQADIMDTAQRARVHEEVATWRPELRPRQRRQLEWLAAQLAHDPELDDIFSRLIARAGGPAE